MPIPQKQIDSYDVATSISEDTTFIAVENGKTINIKSKVIDDYIKKNTKYITHEEIDQLFI